MFIVLDTNIYLHYKFFEDIPWKEELGCDDVVLLIPSLVVEEVDRKKDNERGKIQKRAKTVSRRFGELLIDGKRGNYPVRYLECPFATEEERRQFNLDRNDNLVLFSVLKSGIETNEVCVVSSDNTMLIRAKQMGFRICRLDERYKLPSDLTEDEKTIRELKAELDRYRNRRSAPRLEFLGGDSHIQISRSKKYNVGEVFTQRIVELQKRWPKKDMSEYGYSKIQIAEYNCSVDDFLRKSEFKIRLEIAREALKQRMIGISIYLSNSGTAATGNLDLFLQFPEDVHIYVGEKTTRFSYEKPITPGFSSNMILLPHQGNVNPDIEIWDLDKYEKKTEFNIASTPLTHNLTRKAFEFYVDSETCHNFMIQWKIVDSSLLDLVTGELNVSFVEDNNPAVS